MDYLKRLDETIQLLEKEADNLGNLSEIGRVMGEVADELSEEKRVLLDNSARLSKSVESLQTSIRMLNDSIDQKLMVISGEVDQKITDAKNDQIKKLDETKNDFLTRIESEKTDLQTMIESAKADCLNQVVKSNEELTTQIKSTEENYLLQLNKIDEGLKERIRLAEAENKLAQQELGQKIGKLNTLVIVTLIIALITCGISIIPLIH